MLIEVTTAWDGSCAAVGGAWELRGKDMGKGMPHMKHDGSTPPGLHAQGGPRCLPLACWPLLPMPCHASLPALASP